MVVLVCNGVGSCLCPILLRMILMYTASLAMMYDAANSASVADDMTFLMMGCWMVFGPEIGVIQFSWSPEYSELLLAFPDF